MYKYIVQLQHKNDSFIGESALLFKLHQMCLCDWDVFCFNSFFNQHQTLFQAPKEKDLSSIAFGC